MEHIYEVDKNGVSTVHRFEFTGYKGARAVYARYTTTYSIAKGVITDNEYTGDYTSDYQLYTPNY